MSRTIEWIMSGTLKGTGLVGFALALFCCVPSQSRGEPPDDTAAPPARNGQVAASSGSESGHVPGPARTEDNPLIDPVSEQGQLARGMYITGPFVRVLGVEAIIERVRAARLSAVVIDLKDGAGRVTYDTDIEILEPQQQNFLGDAPALIQRLKAEGIYTIARIVCFADPQLPARHPERAIMDNRPNRRERPWRSWGTAGTWLDPYNSLNHDMVIEIAAEAEEIGFDEVQLDYVRWPVDDGTQYARYPAETPESPERWEVLKGFLGRMDQRLHIPIGCDVFGLTAFDFGNPLPLGQKLDEWAEYVEVFSPMLYVNAMKTWGRGEPDRDRRLIEAGVTQLRHRLGPQPIIRPFLQAFAEGADDPGPGFIARQIRGARRGGADGYLFWHPGSRYGMLYREAHGAARSENRPFPIERRRRAREAAIADRRNSESSEPEPRGRRRRSPERRSHRH